MFQSNQPCEAQKTIKRFSASRGVARFVALLALGAGAMSATSGCAGAAEVTVADFAVEQQPRIVLAGEDTTPSPTGFSVSWQAQGAASPGAVRLNYDFSQGGRRALVEVGGFLPSQISQVNVSVRAPQKTVLALRLIDAKNESFWVRLDYTGTGNWQTLSADVNDPALWQHGFRAPDDGVLDQPLRAINIGLWRGENPLASSFDLDQITVVTALNETQLAAERAAFAAKPAPAVPAPPAAPKPAPPVNADPQKAPLRFSTTVPGNLFYPTDAVKATLAANVDAAAIPRLGVRAKVFDARDTLVTELPPLALSRANGFSANLELPKALGFYRIALEVEGKLHPFEARYAVIPANRGAAKNPASPFGVNTHFNQAWPVSVGAIVKRAGIAWIREGQPSHFDQAVSVARANGLAYFPVFTSYPRPMDKNKRPDGTWDFSDVAAWHRRYAEIYGADVDYYDLVNEPHHNWMKLGGSWDGGPWIKPFTVYGRQISEALKAADPGAKIAWEDIDQLIWYRQFFAQGAKADVIDIISPHPYNFHRYASLPEEQAMLPQLPAFREFTRQNNLPWTVWTGEVGYSSYRGTAPAIGYDPYTEQQQANLLVRMMTVQLAGGVEKIFWYDMRNDGTVATNPEHNFGLIRFDSQPKPAIVAYANLIHQFNDGKWLGRLQTGDANMYVYAFLPRGSEQPVIVAWMRRGTKNLTVPIPMSVGRVAITDIYGAPRQATLRGGILQIELSESPLYISIAGLTQARIAPLLPPSQTAPVR